MASKKVRKYLIPHLPEKNTPQSRPKIFHLPAQLFGNPAAKKIIFLG